MVKEIGVVGKEYKGAPRRKKVSYDDAPPSVTTQTARVVSVCDGWLVADGMSETSVSYLECSFYFNVC